jgi:hypothetical protein
MIKVMFFSICMINTLFSNFLVWLLPAPVNTNKIANSGEREPKKRGGIIGKGRVAFNTLKDEYF